MYDFEQLDHYQILGVDRTATPDEIKRAYRQAISLYHPDRFVHGSAEERRYASARTQRINEAYRTLNDQSARSQGKLGRGAKRARPNPSQPPQPRDHLAELYTQAQEHMGAGRYVQAAAVLRQLQQLSPLYRDSAELLAEAERRLGAAPPLTAVPPSPPLTRRLALLGGLGGLLALGAMAWLIGSRAASGSTPLALPSPAASLAAAVAEAPTLEPTSAPTREPGAQPSLEPSAEATSVPTLEPTSTPRPAPTSEPTLEPTSVPTLAPTPQPTVAPASLERGLLVAGSSFDGGSGWAFASGDGWSVGEDGGRYRILAAADIGDIWSYRTLPAAPPLSIGVDMQVSGGPAGLAFRFSDGDNYLAFVLDPQAGTWQVRSKRFGSSTVLAEGTVGALEADAPTRLVLVLGVSSAAFAVDGQIVADILLDGLPDGPYYGLLALGTMTSVEASFDNLEIRAAE